jgi:RNA polymerase sigma-70 factor, ECF subfamily
MQRPADERFNVIYQQHFDAVAAYVRRRVPRDVADDVVSETFLVCWRKLDDVPAEALPWLYAVARKTLANQRRTVARQEMPVSVEIAVDAPPLIGDQLLGEAFARLSESDREVLRLVAWEGLSPRQAAIVLGCSAVACRVRLHRAKRRLANRLAEQDRSAAAVQPRPHPEGGSQ